MIPSVTALILSWQTVLGTFFLSILGIRRTRHPAMESPENDEQGRLAAGHPVTGMPGRPAADGNPRPLPEVCGSAAARADAAPPGD